MLKWLCGRMALVVVFFISVLPVLQAADLTLAVTAPRGPLEAKKWDVLAKHLTASVGKSFEIMPFSASQMNDAIGSGHIDFALVNPVSAAIAVEKKTAKALATMKVDGTTYLAGVIFAKKGGKVQSIADLKGKNVMGYQFGLSAAAYVFQVYHLKQQGIDAHRDFASFKDAKKQDDIVLAVQTGVIDAGFVKTGILESMAKEGKIKLEDFVILDQKKDELDFVHSTDLYPDWFLLAGERVDSALVAKVKEVVLKLKPTDEAATAAKIDGFVDAQSLDSMKAALKALKLAPYGG